MEIRDWNYRIYETVNGTNGIIEVYYDRDGNIVDWMKGFIEPVGNTQEHLLENLQLMLKATELPVLKKVDLKNIGAGYDYESNKRNKT